MSSATSLLAQSQARLSGIYDRIEKRKAAEQSAMAKLEKARATEQKAIDTKRLAMITNPTAVDETIVNRMRQWLPDGTTVNARKHPDKLRALEAAFPDSDPRKGMAKAIKQKFARAVSMPEYRQVDPDKLMEFIYRDELNARKEDIHQYAYDAKHGFRLFPGGPDVAELPDQEEWEAKRHRGEYTSVAGAASFITGLHVGGRAAARGIAASPKLLAAAKMIPGIGGRIAAGIGVAAATPILSGLATAVGVGTTAWMIGEFIANQVKDSDWGQEHPMAAEAIGLASFVGADIAIGKVAGKVSARLANKANKASAAAMKAEKEGTLKSFVDADEAAKGLESEVAETRDAVMADIDKELEAATAKPRKKKKTGRKGKKGKSEPVKEGAPTDEPKFVDIWAGVDEETAKDLKFSDIKPENVERVFAQVTSGIPAKEAVENVGKLQVSAEKWDDPVEAISNMTRRFDLAEDDAVASAVELMPKGNKSTFDISRGISESATEDARMRALEKPELFAKRSDIPPEPPSPTLVSTKTGTKKGVARRAKDEPIVEPLPRTFEKRFLRKKGDKPTGVARPRATVSEEEIIEKRKEFAFGTQREVDPIVPRLKDTMPKNYKSAEFDEFANGLSHHERYLLIEEGNLPYNARAKLEKIQREANIELQFNSEVEVKARESARREALGRFIDDPIGAVKDDLIADIVGSTEGAIEKKVPTKATKAAAKKAEQLNKLKSKRAAGKTLTPEEDAMLDFAGEEERVASKLRNQIILAGVTVPVITALGISVPDDANAAGITGVVTNLVKGAAESAGRANVKDTLKYYFEKAVRAGWIETPVKEGQTYLPRYVRPPKMGSSFNDLIGNFRKRAPEIKEKLWHGALSPHVRAHKFFVDDTGKDTMNAMHPQWAMHMYSAKTNTKQSLEVLENIKALNPNYANMSVETAAAYENLVKTYTGDILEYGHHESMISKLQRDIKSMEGKVTKHNARKQLSKKGLKAKKDSEAALAEFKDKLGMHEKAYEKLEPTVQAYREEWEDITKKLAADPRFSNVRVFLAAEDTADYAKYPFLNGLMSLEEKAMVGKVKDMMQYYKKRLQLSGAHVMEEPFIHHVAHPGINFNELQNRMSNVVGNASYSAPMVKIHSRSLNMMPNMPDLDYSLSKYFSDMNVRLEARNFWNKGMIQKGPRGGVKEVGWKAFMNHPEVQANPIMSRIFREFKESFKPRELDGANKWAERIYTFEVLRLLSGSASVPLKHGFKLGADLRIMGPQAFDTMGVSMRSMLRNKYRSNVAASTDPWIKKMGLDEKTIDNFLRTVTNQGRMVQIMSDMETPRFGEAAWDGVMRKITDVGSIPVTTVEHYDRYQSAMSSMLMAANKGMTPAQAFYSVQDTVLKANFLSGHFSPEWLKDPMMRLTFLFQGTAFKIFEQRLDMWSRAGKSIKKALRLNSAMKKMSDDEILQMAKDLKYTIREGETNFKKSMIFSALKSEQDIFGTPYTQQMMRDMIVGGILIAGGYGMGVNLTHHVFHLPFIKPHESELGLAFSPLVEASYKSLMRDKGTDDYPDEFMFNQFLKDWMGRGGPLPQIVHKMMRLSKNDIPEIYRDSSFQYLFALPSVGE